MYRYNFPAIKNADYYFIQSKKIEEEAAEVSEEALSVHTDFRHLVEETYDTMQACETMLRSLADKVDTQKVYEEVIKKNAKRNYYK